MQTITVSELKQWQDSKKDFQLLDVREQWEYDLCRLDGATLAPLGTLQIKPPELDKEEPLVVYCHHGSRSKMGCMILTSLGFKNTFTLTGGIDAYATEVDPSIEKY